jgi:hypothetical protein
MYFPWPFPPDLANDGLRPACGLEAEAERSETRFDKGCGWLSPGPWGPILGFGVLPGKVVFPFGGSGKDPNGLDPSRTRLDRIPGLVVGSAETFFGSPRSQLYASLNARSASFLVSSGILAGRMWARLQPGLQSPTLWYLAQRLRFSLIFVLWCLTLRSRAKLTRPFADPGSKWSWNLDPEGRAHSVNGDGFFFHQLGLSYRSESDSWSFS